MAEKTSEVPTWPSIAKGSPRQMALLFGEARWYLWMQEENKQAISSLRRDLLLLHQNGDLELFKEKCSPPTGTYVAALYDGKMIRGRICHSRNKQENVNRSSTTVCVIDLDEGRWLDVPLNQVRVLPLEMRCLPCQAIRLDIGLDCIEQFEWPAQINNMLLKALNRALLFVEHISNRPGSIPTITGTVTVCNSASGQSTSIQKWLIDVFSPHLDICSFERFKPFPVGMSSELMVNSTALNQQPVFGMSMHRLPQTGPPSYTPGVPVRMSPNLQPKYPHGLQPGLHLGTHSRVLPGMNHVLYPGMLPGLPHGPAPGFAPAQHMMPPAQHMMPPAQHMMPPAQHMMPSAQHMMPPAQHMMPPAQHRMPPAQHMMPCPAPAIPPHDKLHRPLPSISQKHQQKPPPQSLSGANASFNWEMSGSNSSRSSVCVGLSSPILDKSDGSGVKESSVEIDLTATSLDSSSSVTSGPNPLAAPFVSKELSALSQSPSSTKSKSKENPKSPTVSCTRGTERASVKSDSGSSSSNLSAKASPFVPNMSNCLSKKGENPAAPSSLPESSNMSMQGAGNPGNAKTAETSTIPKSSANCSNSLPTEKKSTPILSKENHISPLQKASPSSSFPQGKEVELTQILRTWKVGQVVSAFMAQVWNPSCFEVNVIDEYCGILTSLQEEMKEYYKSHKVVTTSKQQVQDMCGDFCACLDADGEVWFRAQVIEWYIEDSVTPLKVWAVDFGGYSHVDLSCVQPLFTELACTSPILVTICSMKNITSRSDYDIWPEKHLNRAKELLPEDRELFLRIDGAQSKEDIWPVSVFTDPECSMQSINEILVAEGCAYYIGLVPERTEDSSESTNDENAEDPMKEAYDIGGDNYELDDEDACMAVSGRKPTEEVGICWFYQRKGFCYKSFCELKHVRLDPDGHSIAKEETLAHSFEKIDDFVLNPGSQVRLTVTRIMTVNHFIATLHTKGTRGIKSRETLKSMLQNLNSVQMKRSLKTFTEFPGDGEIVLYKDKDGMFYRGRIISSDVGNDNSFNVLNVDSGYMRKVALKDLRRVDSAFLHHPFQAIECWLSDVAPSQSDREWTKTCNIVFADLVKDQKLTATVVRSSPWGIEVNLVDKTGQDIAILLKELNIVKSCPMRHLPLSSSQNLPG